MRKATLEDCEALYALYLKVAAHPGGLARTADEITPAYINKIVNTSLNRGLIFVAQSENTLIGLIFASKLDPRVFAHVLTDLSVLVDPDFQGMGVGSALFKALFDEIKQYHPEIMRVELVARESNPAIKLYERLGFVREGEFKKRIRGVSGKYESDIPMVWFNSEFRS